MRNLRSILESEGLRVAGDSTLVDLPTLEKFLRGLGVSTSHTTSEPHIVEAFIPWGAGSLYIYVESDRVDLSGEDNLPNPSISNIYRSKTWDPKGLAQAIKSYPKYTETPKLSVKRGDKIYVFEDTMLPAKVLSLNPLKLRVSLDWKPWTSTFEHTEANYWRAVEGKNRGTSFRLFDKLQRPLYL